MCVLACARVCVCVSVCEPKVRIDRWSREDIVLGGVRIHTHTLYIPDETDELITRPFGERIASSAQK